MTAMTAQGSAGRLADGVETPLFADLDPPQNFALRSDESSANERQIVWRSSLKSVSSFCR
jgi:hypothetical protein